MRFIRWSKAARSDRAFTPDVMAVSRVRRFLLLELIVLAALPLLASMMARGITTLLPAA